ncbi:hypothetical protein [Streptomyces pseudovenezuelae]|uniref:hypothetical protein n=1 Tax=Streptomyces pseudovenezuelae TaxID=67350 RepID=UPI002E3363C5|nr:hypothetical protein [Streptomyces pseudovenezuelae]
MTSELPGSPGPKLTAIYEAMSDEERDALVKVLVERAMPAEQLAALLTHHGRAVSASTIRTYRRSLRREGVTGVRSR